MSAVLEEFHRDEPYFDRATSEALTASESSIGSSGGTTLVMIRMQSSKSLDFLRSRSIPERESSKHSYGVNLSGEALPLVHTYQLAAIAKIKRKPMKRKDSVLFAEIRSVEKI